MYHSGRARLPGCLAGRPAGADVNQVETGARARPFLCERELAHAPLASRAVPKPPPPPPAALEAHQDANNYNGSAS